MANRLNNDVVIVGAGIVGCATAYFLARAGLSVTVLDPNGIAAGASGRNNGLVEHPYDAATVGLFDETVELLAQVLGHGFPREPIGTLLLTHDEASAQALERQYSVFPSLAARALDPDQARATEPLLAQGLWACMLNTGHPIMPVEATTAFADLARARGAEFVLGEPLRLVSEAEQVRAVSSGPDQYRAPTILICAGAASAAVLDGLVSPEIIKPLWGVIVSVELPMRPRHPLIEGALAAAHGSGDVEVEAPFTLLDSPSWLAVGSTMLEGDEPDGAVWAPRLLARGCEFVPSIAQAHVKGILACARPRAFDNRPILGRLPGQEQLWIAAGHGGRGMSVGPASARLLADAILAGDEAVIAEQISTRRLTR